MSRRSGFSPPHPASSPPLPPAELLRRWGLSRMQTNNYKRLSILHNITPDNVYLCTIPTDYKLQTARCLRTWSSEDLIILPLIIYYSFIGLFTLP